MPNQEINTTDAPQGGTYSETIADHNLWRYMVIKPNTGCSLRGDKLSQACRISDLDIWIEYWNVLSKIDDDEVRSLGGSPAQILRFLTSYNDTFHVIKKPDFEHLKDVIKLRKQLAEEEFPSIVNALKMFREQDVNAETALKHLGYFAIIESILSHAPKPNDSADSISRQLKRNLILIDNRMENKFNLMLDKFEATKPETIITKLYSYRSSIAHGNTSNKEIDWFYENRSEVEKENNVKFLNRGQFMSWYLRKLTQRILVHSLREPRLIIDLKG